MINRYVTFFAFLAVLVIPSISSAQTQILSTSPPTVEYQYQMYYPRFWGSGWGGGYYGGYGGYGGYDGYGGYGAYGGYGGWGGGWQGPGLSLGGSLPVQGREGISSFYGRPFPVPFGAGVYPNSYAYATQLPGPPNTFGLATSAPASMTAPAMAGPSANPASGLNGGNVSASGQVPNSPSGANSGTTVRPDVSHRPVQLSSLETLEKARLIISIGDEKLRNRQWMQAYINYRNAALIADDLPEAHVRLSMASLAMNRFPESASELKRALFIDPTAVKPDANLSAILGPEGQPVRKEITRSVAEWARENLRDQDRLFLLGAVLQSEGDRRAPEILQAAYKLTGSGDHLVALMNSPTRPVATASESVPPPVPVPPESQKLPELHLQPVVLH